MGEGAATGDEGDRGIAMTRVFDAPRERVWREWTEPERFADWFGGPGCEIPLSTVSMDVRPGGAWRATMYCGDDRREIRWAGEYREVAAPARLVFTVTDRPEEDARELVTVDLAELADGRTEMRFRQRGALPPEAYREAERGWGGFFDRIAERLAGGSRRWVPAPPPVRTETGTTEEAVMAEVRLTMTMSVDGYVAGPDQSVDNPLGVGAERLHEWIVGTRSWRATHGLEGGETGPGDDVGREMLENAGATIMGRNMFGPIRGPWPDGAWRGWWGEEPPFHHPVFVLTHHAREPLEMRGGTTFHFVTGGPEEALARARAAAGERDVHIGGGADVARQFLVAGLVDRMDLSVAPILLGGGERVFEGTDGAQRGFEAVRVIPTAAATHVRFRRSR